VVGRALPLLVSAIAGIMLGSIATMLLTAPPDHRGELPAGMLAPAPLPAPAAVTPAPAFAPTPGAEAPELLAARQALAMRLRSPDALLLSDVRVYDFGVPEERAVCGTMRSPEIAGGSARFVVRVLQPRGAAARPPSAVVEDAPWLVRPSPEAARRFCREPEPMAAMPPATAPEAPAPPLPGTAPAAMAMAGGRVMTQSPANLRATPAGEVLMSIPRGRTLIVFDRAPGGWVQVGETAPQGWVHSSLLSDAASP
jgi:hypothetical protein